MKAAIYKTREGWRVRIQMEEGGRWVKWLKRYRTESRAIFAVDCFERYHRTWKNNNNNRRGGVKTVRQYIKEYDSNGVTVIDEGNGCSGPKWVDAEDLTPEQLDAEVEELAPYGVDDGHDLCREALAYVVGIVAAGSAAATAWLYRDNETCTDNPYRYRIVL